MTALTVQHRFFPSLRIGLTPSAVYGQREGIKVHCRQGEWDSACGLHCSAMALTLLGRLNGVSNLFRRRNGVGAALWKAGLESYFDGLSGDQLAELICAIDPNVHARSFKGTHHQLVKRTQAQLEHGCLVIVGLLSGNGEYDHWILAVGLEGTQKESGFTTSAILCLDPSADEPMFTAYNGRLELDSTASSRRAGSLRYLTNVGDMISATLTEAVVIGSTE